MYPGCWTSAEVPEKKKKNWVRLTRGLKMGEKQDLKARIEWWSQSPDPRTKSKQSSSVKIESQRPGIKHWNRKQSGFGMEEGGGLILESLKPYRELLNVLGNLDKRADKKKTTTTILSHTCCWSLCWTGLGWGPYGCWQKSFLRQYL